MTSVAAPGAELEQVYPAVAPWTGGDWEDVTDGADEVAGADLEKGQFLIGVPMCLILATFRQGDIKSNITNELGWYVSLDTIIAPAHEIARAFRRNRIPEENKTSLPEPGERLVFNEGGTGVYRQIVNYLEVKGFIRINSDFPAEGPYGKSRHDVLPPEWEIREDLKASALKIGDDGIPTVQFNIRLLCPRGLRSSKYENEWTKTAETRYIG
jgi:hypothetical protein